MKFKCYNYQPQRLTSFMYQCPLCHRLDTSSMILCELCLSYINQCRRHNRCCIHCGQGVVSGNICGTCLSHQSFIHQFWASYNYTPPISRLIQEWKFSTKIQYSKALGRIMLQNPPTWIKNNDIDYIIAMPTTIASYRQRLFNQSDELAKIISKEYHIPIWSHTAIIKHNQKAQHHLSQKERIKNIKNCFTLHQIPMVSKLLIIDDVATTTATLNELAKSLINHRAYQIYTWVLAR